MDFDLKLQLDDTYPKFKSGLDAFPRMSPHNLWINSSTRLARVAPLNHFLRRSRKRVEATRWLHKKPKCFRLLVLCAAFGSSRDPRTIRGGAMQLTFAIETSRPCGKTFRLALGIFIPFSLVWTVISLARAVLM
jgi:hypothetical protein